MSHDDSEGMQAAAAGSLLQDLVNDSGIMPWINDLGLNGHVDKAIFLSTSEDADGLQLDADTMAMLMHSRGGSAHDDASAGASSRGKREGASLESAGPSKRPARNLDYAEAGVDLECQRAIQGMLHLDGDKQGGASAAGSPSAKARTNAHVNHAHNARANAAAYAGGHGGSKFLAGVAGVRDVAEEDPPHSPADNEHVPPTPSSSGPRRDKGLRSFSLKVCQKVEERDITTYNQVANELVDEFKLDPTITFDEKNIRRRIYDALNVLMAMDIITRDKKNIRWKGFPQSSEKERQILQRRHAELKREVDRKTKEVEKKARQYISLCNIMKRNSTRPLDALPAMAPRINAAKEQCAGEGGSRRGNGGDTAGAGAGAVGGIAGGVGGIGGASGKSHSSHKRSASLMIPFVIVQTDPNNDIHLEWRKEKKEALLRCDKSFELHDDVTVLEFMQMSQVENEQELRQVLSGCPAVASLLIERGAVGILPSADATYNHSNGGGARAGGDAGDAGGGCSSSGIVVKTEEGK